MPSRPKPPQHSPAYDRFIQSMEMNYDKWHDGEGYDLEALKDITPDERKELETLLRGRNDWRDAEALAALNPPATSDLRKKFAGKSTPLVTRLEAGEQLQELGEKVDFTPLLLEMLEAAPEDLSVMSRSFDFIESIKDELDEKVKHKLVKMLSTMKAEPAVNFACITCVVYGISSGQYDWTDRPFWLRFGEANDHAAAFDELLTKIKIDKKDIARWKV